MTTFTMAPLFRQTIGFDRFNDMFETMLNNDKGGNAYPPYNIEKHEDGRYRILVAVAGFDESELDLQVERGVLTVMGGKQQSVADHKSADGEKAGDAKAREADVTYLHQGIAQRAFKLSFRLEDHIEVRAAKLDKGLLHIDLELVVPEAAKPKRIPLNGEQSLLN
jgi:molecular chaperone IbpA